MIVHVQDIGIVVCINQLHFVIEDDGQMLTGLIDSHGCGLFLIAESRDRDEMVTILVVLILLRESSDKQSAICKTLTT